jgi:hypothetical protein
MDYYGEERVMNGYKVGESRENILSDRIGRSSFQAGLFRWESCVLAIRTYFSGLLCLHETQLLGQWLDIIRFCSEAYCSITVHPCFKRRTTHTHARTHEQRYFMDRF